MGLTKKLDVEVAADMIRDGETIRKVAAAFGVSTQAVYLAIKEGRIPKDAA
jgi:DNA invertase Pin-like site-specific DNA recombinase